MNGIDLGIFPPDTQGPHPTTQRNVMEFATNKQNDYYTGTLQNLRGGCNWLEHYYYIQHSWWGWIFQFSFGHDWMEVLLNDVT